MNVTILGFVAVLSCGALLTPLLVEPNRPAASVSIEVDSRVLLTAQRAGCSHGAPEQVGVGSAGRAPVDSDCNRTTRIQLVDAR